MTTMASFLQEQADDLRDSVSKLESQLEDITKELDRHSEHDKEFPLVVRVKGLVDRYKSLAEINERQHTALETLKRHNPLHNDFEAYLYEIAKWGLGNIDTLPSPSDYGLDLENTK